MELRELAETILFGTSLESKLMQPGTVEDAHPVNSISVPQFPGRPNFLQPGARSRTPFPKDKQLESEWGRASVLHFFANHELLAMELMALALLKFTDAPKSFRLGIAKTIREEQEHLLLYRSRMNELGMEFGEIGVNDFFWNTLKNMKTPMDYVTGMSLTFEQANLDYSLHYMNLMDKVGDKETKDLLYRVYDDEIGHLKYGVTWFDKLRNSDVSQWDAYQEAMVGRQPLTIARAKGIGYDQLGRKKAGLDDNFIRNLESHYSSKGRCPDLYVYNADCELEVGYGKPGYNSSQGIKLLMSDFEGLLIFCAKKGDNILCYREPRREFLKYLEERTGKFVEFIPWNGQSSDLLSKCKNRSFSSLVPWGWTPRIKDLENHLDQVSFKFKKGPKFDEQFSQLYWKTTIPKLRKRLREKPLFNQLFGPDIVDGFTLDSMAAVIECIQQIHTKKLPAVIKSKFGFSGSGQCRVYPGKPINVSQAGWIERQLLKYKEVIVEPWLPRLLDGSFVWDSDSVSPQATFFLTDEKGKYRGHKLGSPVFKTGESLRSYLLSHLKGQQSVLGSLRNIGEFVQDYLAGKGYKGPAGFDFFIYLWPETGQIYVKGLCEINCRMTMAHIALGIEEALQVRGPAIWLTLSLTEIQAAGYGSIREFTDYLKSEVPDSNGIVFTNDPELALGAISFLVMDVKVISLLRKTFNLTGVDEQ